MDLLKGLSAHERTNARKLQRFPKQTLDELAVSFAARWPESCAAAFTAIKTALVSAPVLVLPDLSALYTMVCDPCAVPPALGVVLLQHDHPVAYYSRKIFWPRGELLGLRPGNADGSLRPLRVAMLP